MKDNMKKILYMVLTLLTSHTGLNAQNASDYRESRYETVAWNALNNLDYFNFMYVEDFPNTMYAPTDGSMLQFVDPLSYGMENPQIWEVKRDETQKLSRQLYAEVFNAVVNNDGTIVKDSTEPVGTIKGGTDNRIIKNRLDYLFKNSLVFGKYDANKKYYKTLGNNFVRVDNAETSVSGPWQMQFGNPAEVEANLSTAGGKVAEVNQPLMPAFKNVAATLAEHDEFSEFLSILKACALSINNTKDGWQAVDQKHGNLFNLKTKGAVGAEDVVSYSDKATYLLDDYHYTLYVPTNEAMMKAYALGLPTVSQLEQAEIEDEQNDIWSDNPDSKAARIKEVMLNFVKYHIQDDAVFVDNGFKSGYYDSGKLSVIKAVVQNDDTGELEWNGKYMPGRPYKLNVNVSSSAMTVTDCRNGYDDYGTSLGGVTANVVTTPGLYNLVANEIWVESKYIVTSPYTCTIASSSFVVIHAVDSPLIYSNGQHGNPTQFEYQYYPQYNE